MLTYWTWFWAVSGGQFTWQVEFQFPQGLHAVAEASLAKVAGTGSAKAYVMGWASATTGYASSWAGDPDGAPGIVEVPDAGYFIFGLTVDNMWAYAVAKVFVIQ